MTKPLPVVISGGAGRMGRMLVDCVLANPDFLLAGVIERSERLADLKALPCPVSDNPEYIMAAAPEAVVIDFTTAASALAAAGIAASLGRKMVIGATGLDAEQKAALSELAARTPLLWSANMSVGLNALLEILPKLSKTLGDGYDLEIMELHHKRKKDAPSGTALMLGEALAASRGWSLDETRNSERNGLIGERPVQEIGVQALRGGDVVGIHSIYFLGTGEFIEITHQAQSRENFAQGALRAARWIASKGPGKLYSMQDVLAG